MVLKDYKSVTDIILIKQTNILGPFCTWISMSFENSSIDSFKLSHSRLGKIFDMNDTNNFKTFRSREKLDVTWGWRTLIATGIRKPNFFPSNWFWRTRASRLFRLCYQHTLNFLSATPIKAKFSASFEVPYEFEPTIFTIKTLYKLTLFVNDFLL